MKNILKIKLSFLFIIFVFAFFKLKQSSAQGDIHLNIKECYLDNGMQFIILDQHVFPQAVCRLAIRAGSALEDAGK